jgi:hypothetical protein
MVLNLLRECAYLVPMKNGKPLMKNWVIPQNIGDELKKSVGERAAE